MLLIWRKGGKPLIEKLESGDNQNESCKTFEIPLVQTPDDNNESNSKKEKNTIEEFLKLVITTKIITSVEKEFENSKLNMIIYLSITILCTELALLGFRIFRRKRALFLKKKSESLDNEKYISDMVSYILITYALLEYFSTKEKKEFNF
ncbi:hypothetical protein M951_chr360 (nucleomorph) [Lotharella oceanica]|uniref:Uncharacterized protein n=1 Tax=Lotharella oceanica TaxID=641309 RepID=A0A060DH00_9EUKA|nr:hypothetical protein M951_chr284 [Lotharella oceanica]AIB09966.1 hypothetical protein M951_chr360 [Lotharella oceanica]